MPGGSAERGNPDAPKGRSVRQNKMGVSAVDKSEDKKNIQG